MYLFVSFFKTHMWFPETRAEWRTRMYIKHSSVRVNKGKDFTAPPDRERLDQIVILTSNLHEKTEHGTQKWPMSIRWVNCLSRLSVMLHTSMILWATPSSSITQGQKGKQHLQRDWHQRGRRTGTISIKHIRDKFKEIIWGFVWLTCTDITPDESTDCSNLS